MRHFELFIFNKNEKLTTNSWAFLNKTICLQYSKSLDTVLGFQQKRVKRLTANILY